MSKATVLSRAQKALVKLLSTPADGFELEIVEQTSAFIGVTEALRSAEHGSASRLGPNILIAEGCSAQQSVRMMAHAMAVSGADIGTRFENVIVALSQGDDEVQSKPDHKWRDVTLVFDESENMKAKDLITLLRTASFTASRMTINVRLVFVIGMVPKWDFKKRGYFSADYPPMWSDEGLRKQYSSHARAWAFSAKSLTERKPARVWIDEDSQEAQTPLLRDAKVG